MLDLEGIIPAVVTPMDRNAEVDENQLRNYIDWLKGFKGLKGLAINMDTGEGPHLTNEERVRIIRIYREMIKNEMLVIVGIGGQTTRDAEDQAKAARACGADALVVFPHPVFNGAELGPKIPVAYHKAIAEASGLPIILFQLQPALAGAIFSPETLSALASIEQAVALKEASFDAVTFVRTEAVLRKTSPQITLLTGNDNFIYESFLLGAKGALIGFGTIAIQQQIDMHAAAMEKRFHEGQEIWEKIRPLQEAIFAVPVRNYRARIKAALVEIGVIKSTVVRPPLLEIDEEEKEKIRESIAACKLQGITFNP